MTLFNTYHFQNLNFLWLLLILIPYIVFYIWKKPSFKSTLKTPSNAFMKGIENSKIGWYKHSIFALKLIAICLFIIGLSRPQVSMESESVTKLHKEGIDIIISMDASGSMLAQDFKPNRFEASKELAADFVEDRVNDRMGLVIFEGEAYTQCPLTSDINILTDLIDEAQQGVVGQGTAIGMGLATAINRLRESISPSKVIILLTDGVNTHGKIHPLNAAEMATKLNIRVYTIGVGTNGKARTPIAIDPYSGNYIYDYQPVEIDENTLTKIAESTGGKYFRATDNDKLKEIYEEINALETAKIETIEYEIDLPELAYLFIGLGLLALLSSFTINTIIFKSVS